MKKIKIYLFMFIALMAIGSGAYIYITDLKDTIQDQENTIAVQLQNEQALQDQLGMKADSLQDYAVFVKNLTIENEDTENKYILLRNKYYILLDSIIVLNEYADVDTSGNTIVVSFEGSEGKVTYRGHTTYFKLTGEGTYTIQIGIDKMRVESEVYLDKEKFLIRNKIYIDGALIDDAITEIDSALYLLIRNNKLDKPRDLGFFDRLHFLTEVSMEAERVNQIYIPGKLSFLIGTEYQFNQFRVFGKFDLINQAINMGIQYHPSVRDIYRAIF